MTYFELIKQVHIQNIRVAACEYRRKSRIESATNQIQITQKTTAKVRQQKDHLIGSVKFSIDGTQTGSTSPTFTFSLTLVAVYSLEHGIKVPANVLDEFGEKNVVYNAWPYFRFYVQEATSRMGLPPLTIPVLRRL